MARKVKVGIIGSQFISTIHAESLERCAAAETVGVASPTPGNAEQLAGQFGIPHSFTDYRDLLAMDEIDMVVIGIPNDLHCEVVVAAAQAGKHIVIEKPFCLNLAEADQMIDAARIANVKLMYAEELCFAPKYVRLKQLLDSGALGEPTLIKQSEKHMMGRTRRIFGILIDPAVVSTMDMGCHAIEFFRWMLGRPPVKSVYAQMNTHVHGRQDDRRRQRDHHPRV